MREFGGKSPQRRCLASIHVRINVKVFLADAAFDAWYVYSAIGILGTKP